MLQQMIERDSLECISVTGCLDRDGNVMAAECSRKIDQWGDTLAVGTLFEVCERPHFFDHALDAVRQVLGTGVFEFEVLHDTRDGRVLGDRPQPTRVRADVARRRSGESTTSALVPIGDRPGGHRSTIPNPSTTPLDDGDAVRCRGRRPAGVVPRSTRRWARGDLAAAQAEDKRDVLVARPGARFRARDVDAAAPRRLDQALRRIDSSRPEPRRPQAFVWPLTVTYSGVSEGVPPARPVRTHSWSFTEAAMIRGNTRAFQSM